LTALLLVVAVTGLACSSSSDDQGDPTPNNLLTSTATPGQTAADFTLPEGPTLADVTLTDAPSYLFLFTHTEDPFNHELSEERYWRIGAMIEEIAETYPDLDLTWTIEFQGSDAKTVTDRNDETGLVDYLLSLQDHGLVEFGYHAHHDPTYLNRPQNELNPGSTYDEVYNALWSWITCVKDVLYGGCMEERGGGLEAILNAFGQVEIVTGLGVGEGFQLERSAGSQAVRELLPERLLGYGFPDHGSLIQSQSYREAREALLELMTPTNETTSATLWIDNSVRINDSASLEGVNTGRMHDGPELLAPTLEGLDGSKSFVINIGIADKYLYTVDTTSPTKWGYANPDSPELPAQYLHPTSETDKRYARTQQGLEYLAQLVTDNPKLQFVSSDQVVDLFTSDDYWNVDEDELEQMALWALNHWDSRPPAWTYDGEDFYSLADTFALLEAGLNGTLDGDIVSNVSGPWSRAQAQTQASEVSVLDLRTLLDHGLVGDGRIQEAYTVGGHTLTATQLLYALSYLYIYDRYSVSADAIQIAATGTTPQTFDYLDDLGCPCLDTAWSLKPARFQNLLPD
jgi:hypothetical protein